MTTDRKTELRDLVRRQLLYYLKEAIDGESELLMKEVWEQCHAHVEIEAVQDELRELHELIHKRLTT